MQCQISVFLLPFTTRTLPTIYIYINIVYLQTGKKKPSAKFTDRQTTKWLYLYEQIVLKYSRLSIYKLVINLTIFQSKSES